MICNRPDISSADRWEFVKDFVEDFVAILVAIHFATPFATKNDRDNFAIISLKISLLHFKFWRNPNEILAKINVARSYGKTFCHKKTPDKKSDEILTKWKRKKQRRKSFYQKILQAVGNYGGVRSQYILIWWSTVLVSSFNCESRACYVGNPHKSFFFRVRESNFFFFAKVSRKLDIIIV